MALTDKQKLFVREYLVDLNATAAAERAGYSAKTSRSQGQRLLTNVDIQKAVQDAMKHREARTEVTQDRVVEELAKIAFGDATDFAAVEDGAVVIKDTKDLPRDQRAAIAGIKRGKNGIEVTRYDKMRALELLGKHLGLFDQKTDREDEPEEDGFLDALRGEAGDVWQE